ncbi:MAG: hypothetical protein HYZ28_05165 [Myxococcales bacterium]|nr:hypothetical protein [Myxococcales bacterium]
MRNGPTVVPLELAAGLVEGATPALGYSVTLGYARGELRGYAEGMEAVIDRFHLDERLAGALLLAEPEAAARKQKMSEWNADLDASDEAIDRIQSWLGEQVDKVKGREVEGKYLGHLRLTDRMHMNSPLSPTR